MRKTTMIVLLAALGVVFLAGAVYARDSWGAWGSFSYAPASGYGFNVIYQSSPYYVNSATHYPCGYRHRDGYGWCDGNWRDHRGWDRHIIYGSTPYMMGPRRCW